MAKSNVSVKCYVDSCHYWGQNNLCQAELIEVDNQFVGDEHGDLSWAARMKKPRRLLPDLQAQNWGRLTPVTGAVLIRVLSVFSRVIPCCWRRQSRLVS